MPAISHLKTTRLMLRELTPDDADFVRELVNEEAFLAHIGDRGIRTTDDARRYLREGPWTRYREVGFGFFAVERRDAPGVIGVCGLAKREYLDAPDIGFAFLAAHRGAGYAREAAAAVLRFAAAIGLDRVVATVRTGNVPSRRLLEALGLVEESSFVSPASGQMVALYAMRLGPSPPRSR